jgi:hypothetical protein
MTTIVVSGLTRCGSSLMMQMLYTGGCPISCEPGNEAISGEHSDQLSALREIALGLTDGKAIKCLDPHRFPLPPSRQYVIIWMKRDFKEQAKSITKFMQMLLGVRESKRTMIRKFEKTLPSETRKCHRLLSEYPILEVEFENMIRTPKVEAERVANFIKEIVQLDTGKMASVVIERSTDCYSGMLELEILQKLNTTS